VIVTIHLPPQKGRSLMMLMVIRATASGFQEAVRALEPPSIKVGRYINGVVAY
jgi:hypothetical protein